MELKIDSSGNVVYEDGDLVMIDESEIEEFEQRLALWVEAYHNEVIGDALSRENTIEELYVQSQRVANRFQMVNQILDFQITDESPDSFTISITYEADEERVMEIRMGGEA